MADQLILSASQLRELPRYLRSSVVEWANQPDLSTFKRIVQVELDGDPSASSGLVTHIVFDHDDSSVIRGDQFIVMNTRAKWSKPFPVEVFTYLQSKEDGYGLANT